MIQGYAYALEAEETIDTIFKEFNNYMFCTKNSEGLSIEAKSVLLNTELDTETMASIEKDSVFERIKKAIVALVTKIVDWIKKSFSKLSSGAKKVDGDKLNKFFSKYDSEKKIDKLSKKNVSVEDARGGSGAALNILRKAMNSLLFLGAVGEIDPKYTLPSVDDIMNGDGLIAVGYDEKSVYYTDTENKYKQIKRPIIDFKPYGAIWVTLLDTMIANTVENEYMKTLSTLRMKAMDSEDKDEVELIKNQVSALSRVLKTYSKLLHIAMRSNIALNTLEESGYI